MIPNMGIGCHVNNTHFAIYLENVQPHQAPDVRVWGIPVLFQDTHVILPDPSHSYWDQLLNFKICIISKVWEMCKTLNKAELQSVSNFCEHPEPTSTYRFGATLWSSVHSDWLCPIPSRNLACNLGSLFWSPH